jgi:hypothetical protein
MGAANLPHRLCRKPAHKTSAKKAYEYPTCSLMQQALQVYCIGCVSSRLTKRLQRRRTSIQRAPQRNERFKSASPVGLKRPFPGPTAAGVCPCNDSRAVVLVRECREHLTYFTVFQFNTACPLSEVYLIFTFYLLSYKCSYDHVILHCMIW